jgi:hypothetical protein
MLPRHDRQQESKERINNNNLLRRSGDIWKQFSKMSGGRKFRYGLAGLSG